MAAALKIEVKAWSTEKQEELFRLLVQRVAPAVQGHHFEKAEVDQMIGNDPAYDQVMHYYFTTLLSAGNLSEDTLRESITGRKEARM